MKDLIDDLNVALADLDAKVLEGSKEWAKGRMAALREYKASEEYKEISKKGAWGGMYDALFAVAGGKTWYKVFNENGWNRVEEIVTKHCADVVKKRNASIAKKLEKAGATRIVASDYSRSSDGFHGFYKVETNAGVKCVEIETILAGGYNIQCLHNRVLVKIK